MSVEFQTLHQALTRLLGPTAEVPQSLGARERAFAAQKASVDKDAPMPASVAETRQTVEALAQCLVQHLADTGFIPKAPRVRGRSAHRITQARVSAALRVRPTIVFSYDDTGRVKPLVPEAPGASLPPEAGRDRVSTDAWSHWGTLLHETAHCAFVHIDRPFQTDRLSPDVVEDLNGFLLGPMADARGFWHRCLNESFADVYSSMLLARLAPEALPAVRAEVDNLIWVRRYVREHDFDPAIAERRLVFSAPYQTDLALSRAWAEPEQWLHQSPEALMASALRYASDGLLDVLTPGRPLGATGTVMDERLINYLKREFTDFFEEGPLVSMVAHEVATPQRSRLKAWRKAYPEHPALSFMDKQAAKMDPQGKAARAYIHLEPKERFQATASFLARSVASKGAAVRAELKDRAQVVGEALLSLAEPAPEKPALKRPKM